MKQLMSGSKTYFILAFVIAFLVLLIVPLWFLIGAAGDEEHSSHSHGGVTVSEEEFLSKIKEQQEAYGLPDGSVRLPPGSQAYIVAQQFSFLPHTLRVQPGGQYQLIFFSPDVHHGASLISPEGGSLNTVIMPGMTSMMSIKPTRSGEVLILCNEFCGVGHHLMRGNIIVEGEEVPLQHEQEEHDHEDEENHH